MSLLGLVRHMGEVEGTALDDTYHFVGGGKVMDLRWTYTHMIEEYARHNGHADLLRELVDGRTGLWRQDEGSCISLPGLSPRIGRPLLHVRQAGASGN